MLGSATAVPEMDIATRTTPAMTTGSVNGDGRSAGAGYGGGSVALLFVLFVLFAMAARFLSF
ncbi:hypothetical protein GCM10023195_28440 [Actinoallomurus liliacearum]|uniref:Sporulation protein YjcZ n=1 Tax=Actinoallomurus liliacearum TaxID=1080073 RepID=A0ABP8TG71_9ACTN